MEKEKKPCYFWKQYRYHVNVDEITLKGWIEWCNDMWKLQHRGQPRPADHKIFVNPTMEVATVKARFWNKGQIERWLTDHGYHWTMDVETRYQFPFENEDDVILIDSDKELVKRKKKSA